MLDEVTYYQAVCDWCGRAEDSCDPPAHADDMSAHDAAIEAGWGCYEEEYACPDCLGSMSPQQIRQLKEA